MTYDILFQGSGLSQNQVKSQPWRKTEAQKNALKFQLTPLIRAARIPALEAFFLEVRYNSRHDVDNITPLTKLFVDCLRSCGIIQDDTKKIYRGLTIVPDSALPHNSYMLTIREAVKQKELSETDTKKQ